ncbi:MAG: hypothetical protein ABSC14_00770 [Desulfomonilia bacterium]|jgi:predicted Zn-dependent protease
MTLKYYRLKYSFLSLLIGVLIALAGFSCGSSGNSGSNGTGQDPMALNLVTLYSTVRSITVHVAYEPDAVPFAGAFSDGGQFWSVLENNLNALFLGRITKPDISVPKDLSGMEQISKQAQTSWTTAEIEKLAQSTWDIPQTPTSAEFYVLFVNGYFKDQSGVNQQIIGLSLGGTSIVCVFKDVINASGYDMLIEEVIEQTTLVHEFGHTLGLVNDGVPMVTNHEDSEHPHHCTNENCVMFWENDGSNRNVFIQKIVDSPSDVIYGPECLNDTQSYKP